MRAVVVRGLSQVAVETVEDARIEAPTDALLRVTSTAICGSDLHIYEGRMGDVADMVIGHEPLGVVEEVGPAVASIRRGDRVTVPTHICCGFCQNCVRGYSDACLTTHPGAAGAAYGYPGMGPHRGADAQLLRVPFADANCLRLPGEPGDHWEHDFVLLADACDRARPRLPPRQPARGGVAAVGDSDREPDPDDAERLLHLRAAEARSRAGPGQRALA